MQQAVVPGADFKNTEIVTRLGASKLKKWCKKKKKTYSTLTLVLINKGSDDSVRQNLICIKTQALSDRHLDQFLLDTDVQYVGT